MRHSQYLSPALLIYGIFFLAMWNIRDGSNSLDLTTTNIQIKTHGCLILMSGKKQVYIEKNQVRNAWSQRGAVNFQHD